MPLKENWRRLLEPKSVALIGASESKPAARIAYENIIRHGFLGALHLVNPGHTHLFGRECISDIGEVEPVDVAMILVGRDQVLGAMESAIAAGTGAIIVVSAGFRESRDPLWQKVEMQMSELAASHGIPLIGPNCTGVSAMSARAVMSIAPHPWPIRDGSTTLIMQSGGQLAASSRYLGYIGGGLRASLSLGNAGSVDFADVLDALAEDPLTREIVLLIEEVSEWESFHRAATRLVEQGKWLTAIVVGRSEIGREAAETHTGSIAGDHRLLTSALAQCGIRVGRSLSSTISAAVLQSRLGSQTGRRLGILGMSGSGAALAGDISYYHDTPLPVLSEKAKSELETTGPSIAASNPLDIAGAPFMAPATLRKIVQTFMLDIDFDLSIYLPSHGVPDADTPEHVDVLRGIMDTSADMQRPLIVSQLMPVGVSDAMREWILTYPTVGFVPDFETALESIRLWVDDPLALLELSYPVGSRKMADGDTLEPATKVTVQPCGEYELKRKLGTYSLIAPRSVYLTDSDGHRAAIANLSRTLEFPLVVKGVARTILHKARRGLVALHVDTTEQVIDRVDEMWQRAPELDGILIEEQAAEGTDLLASISRDRLGTLVALAEGGDAARDESTRAWFGVSPSDKELRRGIAYLLGEFSPEVAIYGQEQTVHLVAALKQMLEDLDLEQLEVNPFRLYPDADGLVLDIVGWK